jgi:phosphoenolpyruvate carboxykinase (ATP)
VLLSQPAEKLDALNLSIPTSIPGVDAKFLNPRKAWSDTAAYGEQATKLAKLFQENIKKFDPGAAIVAAGPKA